MRAVEVLNQNPGAVLSTDGQGSWGYIMSPEWKGGPRYMTLVIAVLLPHTARALVERGYAAVDLNGEAR